LAEREQCVLMTMPLPTGTHAVVLAFADGREVLVLRPGLTGMLWRVVVTHELIHLERGLADGGAGHPSPDTWAAVVAREEAKVWAETWRRLGLRSPQSPHFGACLDDPDVFDRLVDLLKHGEPTPG
jgi:hypothetical protein